MNPELDDVFVCTAVRPVAPEVATIVLAPRTDSAVSFHAGQYVTAEFTIDGHGVSRCYTIASPPTRPERLAITVKRAAAGAVSPWLHEGGLTVGSTVRLGRPQGEFTLEQHTASAYLFLTAGTGITPALSVLREAHDLGDDLDLTLVHSQRRVADVPYRRELESIAAMLPNVRLHLVCSDHDPADPAATRGRLDSLLLAQLVPDASAREIFVCGPDGYRATARAAAGNLGVLDVHLHEETFTLTADSSRQRRAPSAAVHNGYRVNFCDQAATIDCAADTTLLDAAIAAGKILLCCSTPRSNLVIERIRDESD